MNNISKTRRKSGFVLVLMSAAAIAMIGALGLAVDMGRLFIVKNEAQAYVDVASLAAALKLNGVTLGITNAGTAATSVATKWNFGTTTVSGPTVEYSTVATGGNWYAAGAVPNPATILYVRVTATVSPSLYFIPVVLTTKVYTQAVNVSAIAGQLDITTFPKGLAPFTAVASSATGPNFGLTPGTEYDIQWPQYNGSRGQCNKGNTLSHVQDCFVKPACAGDWNNLTTLTEVRDAWAASINGYWGFQSGADIRDSVLGTLQLEAVSVGTDILPVLSSGNKASIANYLDDRVNSDPSHVVNTLASYRADATHNGRRLIVVPVVLPATHGSFPSTSVVNGYAEFLLHSDSNNSGNNSNYYQHVIGNDPFCAIYAGPFNIGSMDPGVGSATGAARVRLME